MAQDAGVRSITELRQFGTNLNQASAALPNLFQQLNGQMHSVCDNWNDVQAQRFVPSFDQSKKDIDKIAQEMQQFSAYISKLCDAYEQVTNIRL